MQDETTPAIDLKVGPGVQGIMDRTGNLEAAFVTAWRQPCQWQVGKYVVGYSVPDVVTSTLI